MDQGLSVPCGPQFPSPTLNLSETASSNNNDDVYTNNDDDSEHFPGCILFYTLC